MADSSSSTRMQAHRANIERYRKLLADPLTRVEREYVMRRIGEERAALRHLEQNPGDTSPRPALGIDMLTEREERAAELSWKQRL